MSGSQDKRTSLITILVILSAVLVLFNPWFKITFSENKLLALLYFLTTSSLIFAYYRKQININIIFLLLFLLLIIFQYKTTNYANEYKLTPYETDLQIQRMNQYPPRFAHLAYILEAKKETQLINKLQNNFFNVLDLNQYFPNYFSLLSLPLFLTGLFIFIKTGKKLFLIILATDIIILTFLGVHGIYGPFLIFPFLTFAIFICLEKILTKLKLL